MTRLARSSLGITSLSRQQTNVLPTNGNISKAKVLMRMIEELKKEKEKCERTNQYLMQNTQLICIQNQKLKDAVIHRNIYYQQILDQYSRSSKTLEKEFESNQKMSKIYSSYKNKTNKPQKTNVDYEKKLINDINKIDQEIDDIEKSATCLINKFSESEKKVYDYKLLLSLDSRLTHINKYFTNQAKNCFLKSQSNPELFKQSRLNKLQQKVDKGDETKKILFMSDKEELKKFSTTKKALNCYSNDLDNFLSIYNQILHINKKRIQMNQEELEGNSKSSSKHSSKTRKNKQNPIIFNENFVSEYPKNVNFNDEIDELSRIVGEEDFEYLNDAENDEKYKKIQSLIVPGKYQFYDSEESTESDNENNQEEEEDQNDHLEEEENDIKELELKIGKLLSNKEIQPRSEKVDVSIKTDQKQRKGNKNGKLRKKHIKRQAKQQKATKQDVSVQYSNSMIMKSKLEITKSASLKREETKTNKNSIGNAVITEFVLEEFDEKQDKSSDQEDSNDKDEEIYVSGHLSQSLFLHSAKNLFAKQNKLTVGNELIAEFLIDELDDESVEESEKVNISEFYTDSYNFEESATSTMFEIKNEIITQPETNHYKYPLASEFSPVFLLEELEEDSDKDKSQDELFDDTMLEKTTKEETEHFNRPKIEQLEKAEQKKETELEQANKAKIEQTKKTEKEQFNKPKTEQIKKTETEQTKKTEIKQENKAKIKSIKKIEIEQANKAKIEQAKKTEAEQFNRPKTEIEQANRAKMEQTKKTETEQANKAKIKREKKTEIEQTKKTETEQTKKIETEQAKKIEIEQIKKAEIDQPNKAKMEQTNKPQAKMEQIKKKEIEQAKRVEVDQTKKKESKPLLVHLPKEQPRPATKSNPRKIEGESAPKSGFRTLTSQTQNNNQHLNTHQHKEQSQPIRIKNAEEENEPEYQLKYKTKPCKTSLSQLINILKNIQNTDSENYESMIEENTTSDFVLSETLDESDKTEVSILSNHPKIFLKTDSEQQDEIEEQKASLFLLDLESETPNSPKSAARQRKFEPATKIVTTKPAKQEESHKKLNEKSNDILKNQSVAKYEKSINESTTSEYLTSEISEESDKPIKTEKFLLANIPVLLFSTESEQPEKVEPPKEEETLSLLDLERESETPSSPNSPKSPNSSNPFNTPKSLNTLKSPNSSKPITSSNPSNLPKSLDASKSPNSSNPLNSPKSPNASKPLISPNTQISPKSQDTSKSPNSSKPQNLPNTHIQTDKHEQTDAPKQNTKQPEQLKPKPKMPQQTTSNASPRMEQRHVKFELGNKPSSKPANEPIQLHNVKQTTITKPTKIEQEEQEEPPNKTSLSLLIYTLKNLQKTGPENYESSIEESNTSEDVTSESLLSEMEDESDKPIKTEKFLLANIPVLLFSTESEQPEKVEPPKEEETLSLLDLERESETPSSPNSPKSPNSSNPFNSPKSLDTSKSSKQPNTPKTPSSPKSNTQPFKFERTTTTRPKQQEQTKPLEKAETCKLPNKSSSSLLVHSPKGRSNSCARPTKNAFEPNPVSEHFVSKIKEESDKAMKAAKTLLANQPKSAKRTKPKVSLSLIDLEESETPRRTSKSRTSNKNISIKTNQIEKPTPTPTQTIKETIPQIQPKPTQHVTFNEPSSLLHRTHKERPQSQTQTYKCTLNDELVSSPKSPKNETKQINNDKVTTNKKLPVHPPKEKKVFKSTYDRSVFYTPFDTLSQFDDENSDDNNKVKITVTLKDIGLEGLDSISTVNTAKERPSSVSSNKNQKQASLLDSTQKAQKSHAIKPKTAQKHNPKYNGNNRSNTGNHNTKKVLY